MIATLLVGVHSAHLPVATVPSSGGQPRLAKQVSNFNLSFDKANVPKSWTVLQGKYVRKNVPAF